MDIGKVVHPEQLLSGDICSSPGGYRVVGKVEPDPGTDLVLVSFADRCPGYTDELLMNKDEYVSLVQRRTGQPERLMRKVFCVAHDLKDHEPDISAGREPRDAFEVVNELRELCEQFLLSLPPKSGAP
jgi:hypothetical protein